MTPCSDLKISKLDSDDRYGHSPSAIASISSAVVTNYHHIDHRLITKVAQFQKISFHCFFFLVLSLIGFRWLQCQMDASCAE